MADTYNVYRGVGSADAIDWTTPVGFVAAGVATIDLTGLGHVVGVEYYYGVRAVSAAGVAETNTDRVVRVMVDALGNLVGPPPNDLADDCIAATAAAGGKVHLRVHYNALGEIAVATALQVARVVHGRIDWSSLVQTITPWQGVNGIVLDEVFGHGETVRLAVRAVTADGVAGDHGVADPVTADTTGPPAVDYVEAQQQ